MMRLRGLGSFMLPAGIASRTPIAA